MRYKIGELAKILNVSTNTIRRYEEKGYFESDRGEENGYRYYYDDALFFMSNVRLLRKYGFSHKTIDEMSEMSLEEKEQSYQNLMQELDRQMEYLKNVRHRIKDDVLLINRVKNTKEVYLKDSMHLHVVLYKKGGKILTEPRRQEVIQNFLYEAPETQHVYLIRQEKNGVFCWDAGWAVKDMDLQKYKIALNEYTEEYAPVPSLMGVVKTCMVQNKKTYEGMSEEEVRKFCENHMEYMDRHHLKLAGDIISIVIADVLENGQRFLYTLVSMPIAPRDDIMS